MKHPNRTISASGAKAVMRLYDQGMKKKMDVYTPESVMACPSKKSLEAALEFYGRSPVLKMLLPHDYQRRYYVEKVRPALRWYCKHFGVPIPHWLHGNPDFSPEESDDLFGPGPLNVVEFERLEPQQPPEAGGEAR